MLRESGRLGQSTGGGTREVDGGCGRGWLDNSGEGETARADGKHNMFDSISRVSEPATVLREGKIC